MTPPRRTGGLRSLPGIGPWTSAETRQRACGDADAVSVGDVHLPGAVGLGAVPGGHVSTDARQCWNCSPPMPGHRHLRRAAWWGAQRPPAAAPGPAARPPATSGQSEPGQAVPGKGVAARARQWQTGGRHSRMPGNSRN
jgi:hypothetical protein